MKDGGSRKRANLPARTVKPGVYSGISSTRRVTRQPELRVISGMDWVCREIVKGVAN